MKLVVKLISPNVTRSRWVPDTWSEEGFYEIEREPDRFAGEYLSFDPEANTIVIKKREKTAEEITAEEKAREERDLFTPEAFAELAKRVEILEGRG